MAATKHAQAIKQDSQEYLTTALFQLLETTPLPELKVTTVVQRAGVSRMAFYRNFDTLEDIITDHFRPQIAQLFTLVLTTDTEHKQVAMAEFFTTFSHELHLAVRGRYEYLIQALFDEGMGQYYQQVEINDGISDFAKQYWTRFMSAGVYAIWREWFLQAQPEALPDMHHLIKVLQESTAQALQNGGLE